MLYINYLLNVCLQQLSCGFYMRFQISFKFVQHNYDPLVSLPNNNANETSKCLV